MKKIIFTIIFVFYFVLSFSQNYKEVITIGTVTDAAPYCFKDEKGNFDGYSVDIIKTIMFRLGYEFMFQEFDRVSLQMQGNNVLNEAILSQCDLSLMAIPSVAYKRNHYFSTPYSMVNYLVISRGDNLFGGLKDLISKDIIVQKNSEAERRMSTLKDGYISNLIKVQTVPSGIKMLKEGVGDFMVIDDHVIESFRRSIKNNDLHISLSNFDPLNISVASNNGELIRRINFILEGMRNDGTLNRLYKKWIEVDIDKDYSYYFFAILLFLLAIIAFTLIIIFILGKVVKKAEERAFKALNKNYELVFAINLLLKNSDTDILMYDEITHQLYILNNGEFTIAREDFEDLKSRIHQDDFEQWKVDYFNIITAKVDFVTTKLRVFNQQTQSYDYFEYTVTHAEKNQDGKVARFYYSRRNITALMQDIRKKERVISSFNLAMSSANIIRWRLHIKDKTVKLNFSDGKELLFDTQYLLGVVALSDKEIIKKYILESINGIQQSDIIIKGKYDNYVDYRICKISSLIQRDIDGKPENIYGVINDITDISQSHQKQEELQQSLQSALDAGQMTAWRYDREDDSFISLYGPQINNGHMTMEEYISFVHQDDKDVFPNALQSILNGEIKSATVNFRLKTNSQNYRWYICTLMPIIECGKIKYVTGTRRDITSDMESRIELEQAIIKAEKLNIQQNSYNQLLTTIIEKFPGVLFIKDVNDDFRYLFASTEFCNSSARLPREKIIGHTDFEIYKDYNIASKFRNDDIRVVNLPKGEVVEIGEERLYIDGVESIFHTTKLSIKLPNLRELIIGIAIDITTITNINKSLVLARQKAEESERLKMAFLANMSHEIRTPLNAIVGFSNILQDVVDEDDKREYIDIINHNNDLLLRLIEDILDLSKIESGTVDLKPESFDIVELLNEDYLIWQKKNINTAIDLICESPYDSCIVTLDKSRVSQVGRNFLSNAFKYTPSGTITMGQVLENGGIKIYVKDTGIGIPEEKQHMAFERFAKLDDFAQGTGLGLPICKAIVEACGGDIGFISEVGVGSTFWAWFPCDAKIPDNIYRESSKIGMSSMNAAKCCNDKALNILVAEDNNSNYLLVEAILKNHNLTRAKNGAEAVEFATNIKYDVILMDIRMPVMDGLEATNRIRCFDKLTPIIAVTANAFDSDQVYAKEAGCNAFVSKPLKKKKLEDVLLNICK